MRRMSGLVGGEAGEIKGILARGDKPHCREFVCRSDPRLLEEVGDLEFSNP
jgi:hypothetical protein